MGLISIGLLFVSLSSQLSSDGLFGFKTFRNSSSLPCDFFILMLLKLCSLLHENVTNNLSNLIRGQILCSKGMVQRFPYKRRPASIIWLVEGIGCYSSSIFLWSFTCLLLVVYIGGFVLNGLFLVFIEIVYSVCIGIGQFL